MADLMKHFRSRGSDQDSESGAARRLKTSLIKTGEAENYILYITVQIRLFS